MRNHGTVYGKKPLNKVYSQYPNVYFTLHEGVTVGTTAATCKDENTANNSSGNWKLDVAVPATTGQWQTTEAMWVAKSGNTADHLTLDRTVDTAKFDSIFDVRGVATLYAFHIQWNGAVPTANGRIFSIAGFPGSNAMVEAKYTTSGDVQCFFRDAGITAQRLSASVTDAIVISYADHRASGTKTFTARAYTPGTSNIITTPQSADISSVATYEMTSNTKFRIGAQTTGTGSANQHGDNLRIKRFRFVNFGQNPPSDISELMDELALNNLMGTSR